MNNRGIIMNPNIRTVFRNNNIHKITRYNNNSFFIRFMDWTGSTSTQNDDVKQVIQYMNEHHLELIIEQKGKIKEVYLE